MRLGQILSAVAGLAIIAGLIAHFGLTDLAATVARANVAMLLLYVGVSVTVLLLYSFRWQRIAATFGPVPSIRRFLTVRVIADGVSSLIPPGRVAGDSLRIGMLHADGSPGAMAGASVVLDRFCEAMGNMVVAVTYMGIIALNSTGSAARLEATALTMSLLLVFLLAIVVLLYLGIAPMSRPVAMLTRLIPRLRPLLQALIRVEQHLHDTLRDRPAIFLQGVGLSLLIEMAIACQYALLLHAFGIDVSLPQLGMVILGSGLARAAPSPAALGALEASQVALLGAIGVAPQVGFVVGGVLRLHETFWLTVAALLALTSGLRWPQAAPAAKVSVP